MLAIILFHAIVHAIWRLYIFDYKPREKEPQLEVDGKAPSPELGRATEDYLFGGSFGLPQDSSDEARGVLERQSWNTRPPGTLRLQPVTYSEILSFFTEHCQLQGRL
jgi:hypothetical protein